MCLSVCLYVAYHYENVLSLQYTEIFLALKIEEKIFLIVYTLESPRVKTNVTGVEKERCPTGTRTQSLSLIVRALYH